MKNEEKSNIKKSWLKEQEYFQNKIFRYPFRKCKGNNYALY